MGRETDGKQPIDYRISPNSFYEEYRVQIDPPFVRQKFTREDLQKIYVFDRFRISEARFQPTYLNPENAIEFKDKSILERYYEIPPEFGLLELEMIAFLHEDLESKWLRLIGRAGVGKSTFLDYMFNVYLPTQKGFVNFITLRVDVSAILRMHDKYTYDLTARRLVEALHRTAVSNNFAAPVDNYWDESKLINILRKEVDSRGCHRVIVILDNIDVMPESFQRHSSVFSQSLAFATKCTVITSVRPVNSKNITNPSEGAAIARYDLPQRPPLLSKVIQKRLEYCLKYSKELYEPRKIRFTHGDYTITFKDFQRFFNALTTVLISDSVKEAIENLSNYNIRQALIWALHFIKSWNLDISSLVEPVFKTQISESHRSHVELLDQFIIALGLKNHKLYFNECSDLENVFSSHLSNVEHDLLIKIRCLFYCRAYQPSVRKVDLEKHLCRFGYLPANQKVAIMLLNQAHRQLLESSDCDPNDWGNNQSKDNVDGPPKPVNSQISRHILTSESEYNINSIYESIQSLSITQAGLYYIEKLIYWMNYLQIIADDVWLPESFQFAGGTAYDRFESIYGFIEVIGQRELVETKVYVNNAIGQDEDIRELSYIYGEQPLACRMLKSLESTLRRLQRREQLQDTEKYAHLSGKIITSYENFIREYQRIIHTGTMG